MSTNTLPPRVEPPIRSADTDLFAGTLTLLRSAGAS
jgi:hypothetical protein